MGRSDPALDPRRRRRGGPVPGTGRDGPGHSRRHRPALLFDAMLALEQLEELSFDPRAYDFDHPVNKRPNYLFGQWDMHRLDNAGRCRRFVLQQAALDAMLDRLEQHGRLSCKQVLFEEAAVLAGTMMMGSGVSGNRPDAHDSTVTLATLVQKIANYRDAFYEQLLVRLQGAHAERLRPRPRRCGSRSAGPGSTSIIFWPAAGRNNCSTSTWLTCLPPSAARRPPPGTPTWCRWPRRG